jgi:hypothetical protein
MLAQNFKTPAELGLCDADVEALQKVLGMLERGELHHARLNEPIANGFNMGTIETQHRCGTVCCIAGWAEILRGRKKSGPIPDAAKRDAYRRLIMPTGWQSGRHTVAQAAIALRNYLTDGEPRWAEALAES